MVDSQNDLNDIIDLNWLCSEEDINKKSNKLIYYGRKKENIPMSGTYVRGRFGTEVY